MPSQVVTSVENNFTKGLVTEFTGMNFPENAAISSDNVEYTIIGDTVRRLGTDFEQNFSLTSLTRDSNAINTYKWNNAGGDGITQLVVTQVGNTLNFWNVTNSTTVSPLSNNKLSSSVTISTFTASGGTFDVTQECQFTDGNGYLFVFHPNCDPFYCTFSSGTVAANLITVNIRDFTGIPEVGQADNFRPATLTNSHKYNLYNQGWSEQPGWAATSGTSVFLAAPGTYSWTIQTGLTIAASEFVVLSSVSDIPGQPTIQASGTVVTYTSASGALTLNIANVTYGSTGSTWYFTHPGTSYINTFQTAASLYPSNAEQWWSYKNSSGVYAPSTTLNNVTLGSAPAPKGHYIMPAFAQDRTAASGVSGLTAVSTTVRPTNGCWFQGRIFYTGINASFPPSGTAQFSTWTESIYFSQIVFKTDDFGKCYQANDPTSETLFDLLPTDGGVITIQSSGPIYKLFPIQNGLLVFAANGVWFITGSQGIGFSATDYTITKISNIQSISSNSYVNVMGLPYFWNEEGIYQVKPAQQGGLEVDPITVGTILSFYENIPLSAKKTVKGDYHPLDYVIRWVYRSTDYSNTNQRYTFDKMLNYNVYNKAFYPYTIDTGLASVNGILYVSGPGGITTVEPSFKCFSSTATGVSFAEVWDAGYGDWKSQGGVDVDGKSNFTTGYKVHGQAQRKISIPYVYVFSRLTNGAADFRIQSIWDYANAGESGRWSALQTKNVFAPNFDVISSRIRLRGRGLSVQFRFKSVAGKAFDFIGWSVFETQNTSV